MSVLNEASKKYGFKNVWIYDGRILYKANTDGQKIKSIITRIYFKVLMVTIKMEKRIRLHIFFFCCLNFLFFSLRGFIFVG